MKLLNLIGLFFESDKGTAIPSINKNEGKTKSAGATPFHWACRIIQGLSGPLQSTNVIPTIVKPLKISKAFNLYGFLSVLSEILIDSYLVTYF